MNPQAVQHSHSSSWVAFTYASFIGAVLMLVVSGVESDPARAEGRIRNAIRDGSGLEKLKQIVENQGGDPRAIDDSSRMPSTPDRDLVTAPRDGFVAAMRAEPVGRAAVLLGAGRDRLDAEIDPAVGLMVLAPLGTAVKKGEPIIEIRHRGGRGLEEARRLLHDCIDIGEQMPQPPRLILDRVQGRTARS